MSRIHLGDFQVTLVRAGVYHWDGGAFFGVVPKTLWSRRFPPDERNLVRLAFNCYVVETGEHTALIETGKETALVLAIAHNNRGDAFSAKGEFDRAISDYDLAIKFNPTFSKPFNNRGVAYQKKGEYDRAIKDFDEAIKLSPDYARAFANRAETNQRRHEFQQAARDYDDAIRLQRRPEEGFGGGVVDAPHLLIVVEIPDDGRMADERKALAVERKSASDQAGIEDRDLMGFGQRRRPRLARRRIESVGSRFSGRGSEVIEFTGDEGKRFEFGLLQAHGNLLDSLVGSTPFWLTPPPRQGRG
jgi:tetratricopeptide (TPR) repeat protein